ncbi:putative NodU family carbamoyl transferase [Psychrobacter luti]|uniref:Putative NodU family carbamoyl transferase n=1 Tax=Psychrobacter luti TaxID=198481 RepID=A0A839TCG2_9GAMM|nr:hypothetical protein [Psychrobacter luti]MBB3106116.1 putative NodU family carbamoyl transferase [Psychrobacter luti]
MPKSLIVAAPYVNELVTEGLKLCSHIMEYRHASSQTTLQRETMHKQANHAMQQEKNHHERQMANLYQLSEQFGVTLAHNRQKCVDVIQMYNDSNTMLTKLLDRICEPDLNIEQLQLFKAVIDTLQAKQTELIAHHRSLSSHALTAFKHSSDIMIERLLSLMDVQ